MLYTANAYRELSTGVPFGRLTRYHLGKTLHYLHETVNDDRKATDMATIAVIVNLASASAFTGDLETTTKHLDGLCRIFRMRQGMRTSDVVHLAEMKAQRYVRAGDRSPFSMLSTHMQKRSTP